MDGSNGAAEVNGSVGRVAYGKRLFVGGIPRYRHKEEIHRELSKLVEGVRDVILYPSASDKSKNRGFAFVEFGTEEEAVAARAALGEQKGSLWGKPICVDWAAPEPQVDPSLMATVKVLYVRNLMLHTGEDSIRAHFDAVCPGTVERVKKLRDFAFVHFTQRRFALEAMSRRNGSILDGAVLEVQLAKPTDKAAQLRREAAAASPPPHSAPPFCSASPILGHHPPPPPPPLQLPGPLLPPLVGTASSALSAQKQRMELMARQSEVERTKYLLMQQEQAINEQWKMLDSAAPPLTPLLHGGHPFNFPAADAPGPFHFATPNQHQHRPVPGLHQVPTAAVAEPAQTPQFLRPTIWSTASMEGSLETEKAEAGERKEAPPSNGSSPGLSSHSSAPSVPSFGGISALHAPTAESSNDELRLCGGRDLSELPQTPLFARVFSASSPIPSVANPPKPLSYAFTNQAQNSDSGLEAFSFSLSNSNDPFPFHDRFPSPP